MNRRRLAGYTFFFSLLTLLLGSCAFILDTLWTGGEQQLTPTPPSPSASGPRLIIFALDGTPPAQLMQAIRSGNAPNLAGLLGNERKAIFKDDSDWEQLLRTLSQVTERFHWLCHAYCLIENHYHRVIKTLFCLTAV